MIFPGFQFGSVHKSYEKIHGNLRLPPPPPRFCHVFAQEIYPALISGLSKGQ